VNGAGAALRDTAAIFGAGQAGVLSDRPEQGRIGFDIEIESFAVDCEVCHRYPLIGPILRLSITRILDWKLEAFKSRFCVGER